MLFRCKLIIFTRTTILYPAMYYYLSLILLFIYCLLIIIYRFGWNKSKHVQSVNTKRDLLLSIIIPARNEAANIKTLLQSILANDFPRAQYEIIVIDDFSEDETLKIVQTYFKDIQLANGKVLELSKYLSKEERIIAYKKRALEIAIEQSKGNIIVTTDADCVVPVNWLKSIHLQYQDQNIQFVAAPVNFVPAGKKNSLYYLQSLDFMTMQGITASVNALKMGNMSNGANLSFRKEAYEAVNGYKDLQHLASGDDMMLMNKIEKKFPNGIHYLKSEDSIVSTPCQPNWKSFLHQRIRWASKNGKYSDTKLNLSLLIVYLLNCNIIIITLLALGNGDYLFLLLLTIVLKTIIELFYLYPISKFYKKTQELLWFPWLQPLHICYIVSTGFLGFLGKYEWKGRVVK